MLSPLMDSPLQRQIVLMKLVHEMGNRPDFGSAYDNDPDGAIQQWLARVEALVARVSISRSFTFKSNLQKSTQMWAPAIQSIQAEVFKAIEDLRLELELNGNSDVGSVYEAGHEYQFFQNIVQITQDASREVFVVDPYFDAPTFSSLFSSNFRVAVRVLCGKDSEAVARVAENFSKETGTSALVRKTKKAHDRVLFIDGTDCWVVGSSIKDAGRKPTYLLPLVPELASHKFQIYDEIWGCAAVVP